MSNKLNRQDLEARYRVFEHFALNDQRSFYKSASQRNRKAGQQVNVFRAMFSFLTGVSAAIVGLIVQGYFVPGTQCALDPTSATCTGLQFVAGILTLAAISFPAFGAFFSTLSDLYQWDRLIAIYDTSRENLQVADALSPLDEMPNNIYQTTLEGFAEATLMVMSDETAQWGQSIRTPESIEQFIKRQSEAAKAISKEDSTDTNPNATE